MCCSAECPAWPCPTCACTWCVCCVLRCVALVWLLSAPFWLLSANPAFSVADMTVGAEGPRTSLRLTSPGLTERNFRPVLRCLWAQRWLSPTVPELNYPPTQKCMRASEGKTKNGETAFTTQFFGSRSHARKRQRARERNGERQRARGADERDREGERSLSHARRRFGGASGTQWLIQTPRNFRQNSPKIVLGRHFLPHEELRWKEQNIDKFLKVAAEEKWRKSQYFLRNLEYLLKFSFTPG